MNKSYLLAAAVGLFATPVFSDGHATGDAEAVEAAFRQCQTCHVVQNDDGEVLAGRKAKTGPNLFGLTGRTAGTVDGFRYRPSIVEAGEGGLVWDEETFVAYVQDPTAFLREVLDDDKARSGMSFKLRKEEDARNIWALIVSLSPEPES